MRENGEPLIVVSRDCRGDSGCEPLRQRKIQPAVRTCSSLSRHLVRPGYKRLLEDMRAGQFDVVLAEGLDRLSRDQKRTAALFKRLAF